MESRRPQGTSPLTHGLWNQVSVTQVPSALRRDTSHPCVSVSPPVLYPEG